MLEGERRGRKVFLRRAWLQTRVTWPAQVSARERLLHWRRLSPSGGVTVTPQFQSRARRGPGCVTHGQGSLSLNRVCSSGQSRGRSACSRAGRRPTGTQARPPPQRRGSSPTSLPGSLAAPGGIAEEPGGNSRPQVAQTRPGSGARPFPPAPRRRPSSQHTAASRAASRPS